MTIDLRCLRCDAVFASIDVDPTTTQLPVRPCECIATEDPPRAYSAGYRMGLADRRDIDKACREKE